MVHTALDGAMILWDATSVVDVFYDAYHLGFIWIRCRVGVWERVVELNTL